MNLTVEQLRRIAIGKPSANVIGAIVSTLDKYGEKFGLDLPHRIAQFVAQVAVESGGFARMEESLNYSAKRIRQVFGHRVKTDAEAQKLAGNPKALANRVYGNRKDLGNGGGDDGWNYRGRGPKQITGRANYREFTKWVRKLFPDAPDFEAQPDMILKNPWAGLSMIWFWSTRNCNKYADRGDIEMVTKTINGGLNGYDDRITYLERASLVLLGHGVKDVEAFQKKAGLVVDGISGPRTRAAMHEQLVKLVDRESRPQSVAVAPVVEEKKVAVKDENLEKPFYQSFDGITSIATGPVGVAAVGWISDIPLEKLIFVTAVVAIGTGIYFWNRRRRQVKQEAAVERIEKATL